MKIKDLANAFHPLKKLYALLSTGWVSDENTDHKQFYELPLKFRDYHGTLHNIRSLTVGEDENGEYCVILNGDRWWFYQVTSHTPNREERRKAKR